MEIRRPLKRAAPKLGPPDIYPQDPKQKEDELTSVNVKQGYTSAPLVSGPNTLEEFGSAKDANIAAFGVYFSALLSEKHRVNRLKDTQKKKQLVNTKEIWLVHAKTKHAVDNWFRDLANGTKSLGQLGKRIPSFNNKEGMFAQLYESQVPLAKAIWFIKMSAVHAIAVSEASSKSKKRQVPDHYQELTSALTRYLKEISLRMSECYQQSQQQQSLSQQQQPMLPGQQANMSSNPFNNPQSILQQRTSSGSTLKTAAATTTLPQSMHLSSSSSLGKIPPSPTGLTQQNNTNNIISNNYTSLLNHQPKFAANLNTSIASLMTSHTASSASLSASTMNSLPSMHEDFIPTYNQWQYLTQLARYLFDEGLLDQHDFLCFLLELIEKKRPINDIFVKVICPLILEYVIDFSRSAVLSRRLAHVCAKKSRQALENHPMSAKALRKSDPSQPSTNFQTSSSSSGGSFGSSNNTNSLGINNSFMAKHSLMNSNVNKYNHFESRITDTQSSSLLRNSSSTANNNHLTSNSILDIVKAQIIESQNNLIENLTTDQENSESNLYKNAIYILSSILQVICIECPTAMVRHRIVDAKFPPMYQGSPLDHLPCPPSSLPMMDSDLNFELRKSIYDAEQEIRHRSAMADSKWSCDISSRVENSKGGLVSRLLTVMDILDKHDFDKIDSINSIDILYAKIFPSVDSSSSGSSKLLSNAQSVQSASETGNNSHINSGILDLSASSTYTQSASVDHGKKSKHQTTNNPQNTTTTSGVSASDQAVSCQNLYEEQVIKLLCEWATTTQRTGEHRAIVVARLLEKRQADLQVQANAIESAREPSLSRTKGEDSKSQLNPSDEASASRTGDSNQSENNLDSKEEIVPFSFQNLLVQFLDENAPVIKENQDDNMDTKKAFNNLVLLFSELIRCDVFSHFNYMCTLISRGMFNDVSKGCSINTDGTSNTDSPAPNSNLNQPGSVKPPKSVGKESDSVLASTIQGFSTGNSNIYPLSVSTNIGNQSNHLDPLSGNKLGSSADQSLRSLGFSPVSSQQNVSQNLDKNHGLLDNHIDDVDADLGKILQDINGGQQDEAADILLPDYLGGGSLREESSNKNPQMNKLSPFGLGDRSTLENPTQSSSNVISNSNFQPSSVESKPIVSSVTEEKPSGNPGEHRHMTFVKHFPVPEDENFLYDNNQRIILLYGFGKEREEAKHSMRRMNKDILKLLGRKSCRDISDGAKIKKQTSRELFNPDSTLGKFEALSHHDQHILTNGISVTLLEMFTSVANGQSSLLPSLETISFVFDLFSVASNVSGLLELVIQLLEQLPDVEAQIQSKCPQLQNQYTQSIALCIIGMLYRYHSSLLLLSKEELCSVIESLYKIVPNAQNSNMPISVVCTTSAERVIFHYIYDLYNSQTGRFFEQFSNIYQRVKQVVQNRSAITCDMPVEYDWSPGILTEIVNQLRTAHQYSNSSNNPILNASSANSSMSSFNQMNPDITLIIKQQFYMMDSPTLRMIFESYDARYKLVCEAITLSANSPYPDLVNDIAVLCADITTKCPSLSNEWISALLVLCCSAQRDQKYRILTNRINITEPQVMDNIAIFLAVLIARRCLELDLFIVKCALGSILSPLTFDKQLADPGVRLTCHLLLTLFRDREFPIHQARSQQPPASGHNAFAQNFTNYGNSTPNYGNAFLNSAPPMGLLQTISKDSDNSSKSNLSLKYLCDHHLLRSACCNIKTECHITLLKAIRLLAMWACPSSDETQGRVKTENHFDDMSMDGNHGNKDMEARAFSPGMLNSESNFNLKHIDLQKASLHEFADAILRLLCSQRWLHSKCIADSDIFTTTDIDKNILIDSKIDSKQSQRLLYMICYNKSPEKQADVGLDDQGSDQVASIVNMFENLDVWSMRLSLMRLQFMFAYCKSQPASVLNDWLDNLAKGVVEFFQKASQESESQDKEVEELNESSKRSKLAKSDNQSSNSITDINKVWLIEPLLDKLTKPPSAVQAKIIKATAALMESASVRANSLPSLNQTYLSTAAASTKFKERTLSQRGSASTNPSNLASTSLLGFQPFLSLLLSCLRNQDKERDTLLTSLNSQLYQAIHEKVDDIGYKQSLQDGLELRLCLIGQMFETIQKSANLTSDWATLLLLLIMNNLVDPQVDYGLYVSVLDMLAMLIHSAYASDPIEQREEAKKQYQNLMKKFRKELAALEEKGFIQMKLINPLMPLVRQMTEVITCEPMGSLVDTKGEKVENFESIDKKKGLKVAELQEVSPWDLIEGHKNPAPLSWPWFGAIRIEQKPLRADENNRLMSWHTHTVRHATAYFCQVPNVEDGPSSAKRSHTEKKPSQSNPLLKSLIEAGDESSLLSKKESEAKEQQSNHDDEAMYNDSLDDFYIGREDLLEDYCELPVDLLFDSTPIETMIEDIKTAMQAEHAAIAQRAKPPIVEPKPFLNTANQASSILAPVQPPSEPHTNVVVVPPPPPPHRSTTPQVSALNALQSSVESSLLVNSGPGSVPPLPMAMSPMVNPPTPELLPRPPSNIPKITPTPPPPLSVASRSMSPMVIARSPAITTPTPPPPKPKAQRRKRATKKDSNPMIDANANLPTNININPNSMVGGPILPPPTVVNSYVGSNMDTMNHGAPPPPQMVANQAKLNVAQSSVQSSQISMHQQMTQQQQQGMIVRRGPITQQQQQQQQQQQASVYDFPSYTSQPQPNNQFVNNAPMNSYYEQQGPTNNIFNQPQQPQQPPQMQTTMQPQPQQHQHYPVQPQQQQQQQQHQHHQLQYQQQQPVQHQHQHMQPQQIRLAGHHQQSMSFQQIQHHQQQIFVPQQAAGHSRPALATMLHQKQAAAGPLGRLGPVGAPATGPNGPTGPAGSAAPATPSRMYLHSGQH